MSGASATVTGRGPVTVLTLDRPPVNAMDLELLDAVTAQLQAVANARPAALVVAGRPGCFSAGVDLKAVPGYTAGEKRLMVAGINAIVIAAYALPCPVVAAITGNAIAGGFVLALCADYRIAPDEGRYGLTEVKVGVPYPAAAIGVVRAELEPSAARRLALGSQLRQCRLRAGQGQVADDLGWAAGSLGVMARQRGTGSRPRGIAQPASFAAARSRFFARPGSAGGGGGPRHYVPGEAGGRL